MTDFLSNLRYALRQFRLAPVFTSTAILTLALGIGGTTSIFSSMEKAYGTRNDTQVMYDTLIIASLAAREISHYSDAAGVVAVYHNRYAASVVPNAPDGGTAGFLGSLLEDALIKLSTVATDITGVSGRAIIEALIAGQRDPKLLAELARGPMKAKRAALVDALTGRFDDHHAELARMLLDQIDALTGQIDTLTARIDEHLGALSQTPTIGDGPDADDQSSLGAPPAGDRAARRDRRGESVGLTTIERLDETRLGPHDACGCVGVNGMLLAAKQRGLTITRLDLRNSGDTAGPRDRVVGYGSWALFEPAGQQPAEGPG